MMRLPLALVSSLVLLGCGGPSYDEAAPADQIKVEKGPDGKPTAKSPSGQFNMTADKN
jgi:hypothetical protein